MGGIDGVGLCLFGRGAIRELVDSELLLRACGCIAGTGGVEPANACWLTEGVVTATWTSDSRQKSGWWIQEVRFVW